MIGFVRMIVEGEDGLGFWGRKFWDCVIRVCGLFWGEEVFLLVLV